MKPDLKVLNREDAPKPPPDEKQAPAQSEMPFAVVDGEPVTALPQDLYIPPYALQVFLEAFEGPLDLLLYLIRRQNLDILDIPIAEITKQYVQYIELMNELQLELAGEYERFKKAAQDIGDLPRLDRDTFVVSADAPERQVVTKLPEVTLKELLLAFHDVLRRAQMFSNLHLQREPLSVRQRMSEILTRINARSFSGFADLFDPEEGRMGVAVTFIAILELLRESVIEVVQAEEFSEIHIRAASSVRLVSDEQNA